MRQPRTSRSPTSFEMPRTTVKGVPASAQARATPKASMSSASTPACRSRSARAPSGSAVAAQTVNSPRWRASGAGVESARPEDAHVSVVLAEPDPRAFLARLAAAHDLPAPVAIEHGHLSLRVLYRELYGVEGY